MQVIRLTLRQMIANYRKPFAFNVRESFPLPPPSTVIGMIHRAVGFDTYHEMDVSVCGDYVSRFEDLFVRYEWGSRRADVNSFYNKNSWDVTRNIGKWDLLFDLRLTIHIRMKDALLTDLVFEGLKNPCQFLSLGRHEDLIVVESVEKIETKRNILLEDVIVPQAMYIHLSDIKDIEFDGGRRYELNKVYELKETTKKVLRREWIERVPVVYARNACFYEGSVVWQDEDGYVISWL